MRVREKNPFLRSAKLLENVTRLAGLLSAALVIVLAMLVFYNAIVRYFFGIATVASQELEWHFFAVSFLLAIPYTLRFDKHVRLDLFYQNYSERLKQWLWIISNLCFIMPLSLIVLHYGNDFVMMSYAQNEISDSGGLTHRYLIKAAPLLAFCILFMQSYAEILKSIAWLRSNRKKARVHADVAEQLLDEKGIFEDMEATKQTKKELHYPKIKEQK